ncbi:fluoride efflux transporter CrcB [Streptomyces sp. SID3212]|uniref:fluoride efflux transporter CrcB n=1 Tax=Streptomyces sp. SID3212 TaxID=2690259 RepID=UPI00137111BD|nr:fluoride efflux transporter CrcB [Streptomyces sp. SID3212]MYV55203.1 fluoride efflux transporter CrcB [Streptomyces sp. SID3212]
MDPDVDLHLPAHRAETGAGRRGPVLAVISVGGAAGASARYGADVLWPTAAGSFPWTTFGINVLGCALIGVLMVLITEDGRSAHPLVRPFLGVGVLGGFTTFSTYSLDFHDLLRRHEDAMAVAYAAGTLAGAMTTVWAAALATRWVVRHGGGTARPGGGSPRPGGGAVR